MTDPRIVETETPEQIKARFLRDYRLAAKDAGVTDDLAIGPGSDVDLLGSSVSNTTALVVNKVQIAADAANVFKATEDDLDDIRRSDGLPEVAASAATGKIVPDISGSTTILNGTQFIYPNGVRGTVVGTYINPTDGDPINVEASETGERTNLAAGETVRFVSPPVNVAIEAKVSSEEPLTGGTGVETDARKRARILNNRQNRPAGGNWADIRQLVLDNVGGIQDCYVYPALGGPSSAKIVPIRRFNRDTRDFSRACTTGQLRQVRQLVWSKDSSNDDLVIQAVADETADIGLQVTIPDSALSGGNGLGWLDSAPWPQLVGADSGRCVVASASVSNQTITVTANTTTSPVAGQTSVSWWSPADQRFYTALVTSVSGSSPSWTLTLDRMLFDEDGQEPQSGDYICPAARNLEGYGRQWVEMFQGLGPGENTTDAGRLPRAKRHPFISDEDPTDLTSVVTSTLARNYPEITTIAISYSNKTTATVPSSADTAPNVLIPNHFGVYPA